MTGGESAVRNGSSAPLSLPEQEARPGAEAGQRVWSGANCQGQLASRLLGYRGCWVVGDTPLVIPCPKHKAHMRLALGLKPGHAFPRHTCASPSQTRRVLEAPTSFSGTILQGWHISFSPFKVQSYRCLCVTDFGELPQISLERGITSPTNVSRWSDQARSLA